MGAKESKTPVLGHMVGRDDIKKEMEYIASNYNVVEARIKIKDLLEKWKKISVNIALVGSSKTGKSTFINNFIGEEVAKTDYVECTREAKSYPHPDNNQVVFWDLPGFGGRLYSTLKKYTQAMEFQRFDIILFLHKDFFSADNAVLIQELIKTGKPLFLVRSFFDVVTKHAEPENIENIKEVILKEIREYGLSVEKGSSKKKKAPNEYRCYFIDNHSHDNDYNILMENIFSSLKTYEQQDALAFSVRNRSKVVLQIKEKQLRARIYVVAVLAGGAGAIPIPFVDVAINTSLLVYEVQHMARVLGMLHVLETGSKWSVFSKYLTIPGIINLLKIPIATECADELLKFLPVIGSIVGSTLSFTTTKYYLDKILTDFISVNKAESELLIEALAQTKAGGDSKT